MYMAKHELPPIALHREFGGSFMNDRPRLGTAHMYDSIMTAQAPTRSDLATIMRHPRFKHALSGCRVLMIFISGEW